MAQDREERVSRSLPADHEAERAVLGAILLDHEAIWRVRDRLREEIGEFVEIYCRCPMEILVRRGAGELFEKAQSGELAHVAGVNAPYEEPIKPEVLLNTDQLSVEQSVTQVMATLEVLGRVERVDTACYTPEEEEMIRQRLQDLGYL